MTIAAGFVCADGILLVSDTLYSGGGSPRYGPKFWVFDHGDICVVFGGAGTEAGLLRMRDDIARKLRPGMSRVRAISIVDEAIAKYHAMLPEGLEHKTQSLVAIRAADGNALYENQTHIDFLNSVENPPFRCVGYASSLGVYFARSLFKPWMPMKWARIIGAHLVKQCKDHLEYCGGETHFVEIPDLGAPQQRVDQSEVATLEQYLAGIDDAMRIVLPDGRANDDSLEHRLDMLKRTIEEARRAFAVKITGVTALAVAGGAVSCKITPGPTQDPEPPTKETK